MAVDEDGTLDSIFHDLEHITDIFPADTDLTCTLTALNTANTFSAWAEIEDSGATKLSASFSAESGHITSMLVENISEANTIYMIEIAWGADKNIVTRMRFAGGTKFQAPDMESRFLAPPIPAGELVYYRMKTATAVADSCTVHYRHHAH